MAIKYCATLFEVQVCGYTFKYVNMAYFSIRLLVAIKPLFKF